MRRGITMNMSACIPIRNMPITHHLNNSNMNYETLCRSNGQTFFDKKNYRWIIQCLNDGYGISTDLIELMQEYDNLLRDFIRQLNAYSNKWRSKLKIQSTLSSYHTTKRAQIQTVSLPDNLAQLIQTRCEAIQQVIASYRRQVDRMYPRERLGLVHKHYRSDEMERLFRDAYSDLHKVEEKLEKLRKDETNAQEALRDAKVNYDNLELDKTTSESKLAKANEHLEKQQGELKALQARITRTENNYHQEQETYRHKATKTYQQCRVFEEDRLNQMREALIKFNQAIHSPDYSTKLDAIHEDLLSTIQSQQKTLVDLDFWAQTYRVIDSAKSIPLEEEQNDDDDNENNESQSIENADTSEAEDDETEDTN